MMVKDNIIMSFITRLKSIIDFNLVEIVDYWDGDLLAIGIKRGNSKPSRVLTKVNGLR